MEYRRDDHERSNPWPWVAIIIGILIFLGASWWIATASTRGSRGTLTGQNPPSTTTQPAQQPAGQTSQPGQGGQAGQAGQGGQGGQQPTATQQQPPVNIYIQKTPQQPNQRPVVVIVPEGQQPPQQGGGSQLSQVNLPPRFRYQGSTWQVSDQSVSPNPDDLKDTGANIGGNEIFVMQNDKPPYSAVYVETTPDSGVFVKYTKTAGSQ